MSFFPGLREHLLAAGAGQPATPVTPQQQTSLHNDTNIDPAIAGSGGFSIATADDSTDGPLSESRKGRRELSTTKRAAQNRAAQRAFRHRKEEYIKTLKDQVREYEILAESYRSVQNENHALRDYIVSLQSRLLDTQGDVPPPPSSLDLSRPPPSLDPTVSVVMEGLESPQSQLHLRQKQHAAPTATMTPGVDISRRRIGRK